MKPTNINDWRNQHDKLNPKAILLRHRLIHGDLDDDGNLRLKTLTSFKEGLRIYDDTQEAYVDVPWVINVRSQGAKGDGVTDDSTAIQTAINALPSTGGIVFFPPGKYLVNSTIQLHDKQSVTLRGAGGYTNPASTAATTLTRNSDVDFIEVLSTGVGIASQGITIEDIALNGSGGAGIGIKIDGNSQPTGVARIYIRNVSIESCTYGVYMDGGLITPLIRDSFLQGSIAGIYNAGGTGSLNNLSIQKCWVLASGATAINIPYCIGLTIEDTIVENCVTGIILGNATGGLRVFGAKISRNYGENIATTFIHLDSIIGFEVSGNIFSSGTGEVGTGIVVKDALRGVIVGNHIAGTPTNYAIDVSGGRQEEVTIHSNSPPDDINGTLDSRCFYFKDNKYNFGSEVAAPNLEAVNESRERNDFIKASDFDTINDWTISNINGATAVVGIVDDTQHGVLEIDSGAATDNHGSQVQFTAGGSAGEWVTLEPGKAIVFEARVKVSEATQMDAIIGLCITKVPLATNEGTFIDASDYVVLHTTDGENTWRIISETGGSSTLEQGTTAIVADTWFTLKFIYDGTSIQRYVNGVAEGDAITTNIPIGNAMCVTIAMCNGEATRDTFSIDYYDIRQER